ncbi:hypothetical protein Sjap_005970 [Stephania japonica]|uniref:Cytochrome P450 n=1 Tax=Stephania japonica TaxID=461633 RepID=A0AAP0K534_9MAGN
MAPTPLVLLQRLLEDQQYLMIVLTIFFLATLSSARLRRTWSKKANLPPSPPKFPFIGNFYQLGDLLHHSFRDLSRKYGPIMLLHLGRAPVLVISSAEMAREIMQNHDRVFAYRPALTAAQIILYKCQDIGYAPYGEYYKLARKICVTDLLSVKKVQSFKFIREEETDFFIKKITQSCHKDVQCAFGKSPEDADGINRFGNLSREVMQLLGAFSIGDFFPCLRWMDVLTGLIRRMKTTSQKLDVLFDRIIDEHLTKTDIHHSLDTEQGFLDLLLHVQKENKLNNNISKDNIKAILMDMFLGGTDTTATTIEWAMAELLKSPDTMMKAQAEVRKIVGKKVKVKEEDIQQMEYFKCVIKEALRLHPPLPLLIGRESVTSTQIKEYTIPAKTRVYINAWAIQRDPVLWDKADEFIPERFIGSTIDFTGQDFELVPFGSGRRSCPGVSFGIAVVSLHSLTSCIGLIGICPMEKSRKSWT